MAQNTCRARLDIPTAIATAGEPLDLRTGDLVIVGRNEHQLGLFNGTRAVVTAVDLRTSSLTLHTEDNRRVTLTAAWTPRHDVRHAYAMTIHKAQGLTVDYALLYGAEGLTREAGYVGLSRGRRENHIYTTTDQLSARTDECDFTRADPLAGEEQLTAALARRLNTIRAHRLASHDLAQPGAWRSTRHIEESTRSRAEGLSR